MKKRFKTLTIITNLNVHGLLIFKRHYISLPQGSVQRITRANFDRKIQLAMSLREHLCDRARHLGNQVVALSLTAHDWPLLQKGQLYKQMPQPSINNKLYSKKSYAFDRKLLSSNNFKKKRSCATIKESVNWIWKRKLPERRRRSKRM